MNEIYKQQQNYTSVRLVKQAHWLYGLIFGISLGILVWGIDTWILWRNAAAYPWLKLALGLPMSVLCFSLAGVLGAYIGSIYIKMLIWGIISGCVAYLSGHIPFEGISWLIGKLDADMLQVTMTPFTYAAQVRTTLMIIANVIFGAGAGLLQSFAADWAWDFSSNYRLSFGSYLALFASLPLILLQGLFINGVINQPLRQPQVVINELVQNTLQGYVVPTRTGEASYRAIKPFIDQMTPDYQTYFAGYSTTTDTWFTGYVDIHFSNQTILRCVTFDVRVVFCQDLKAKLSNWVSQVLRYPASGEKPWEYDQVKQLIVAPQVLTWAETLPDQQESDVIISIEKQYADWIFIKGELQNQTTFRCRFHQVEPILLDLCE